MMFSIRSFVLYAVGTSMCGGLLVLLCLPLCALLRRLRAPSKLLCLLWLAVFAFRKAVILFHFGMLLLSFGLLL